MCNTLLTIIQSKKMALRAERPDNATPLRYVTSGILQGITVWAAYAVTEFVCSSLVYRFARPYAVFTTWHWKLTGLLFIGFIAAGAVAGLLAGLVMFYLRGRGVFHGKTSSLIASAATLTLLIAFTTNLF